jgi:DNA-binding transcriptional LysR family regulator
VRVDVVLTQRFVDLVHEGIDLALRVGRLGDSRLVVRPLGTVRAGVFASPRYLERRGAPRTVAALAEHECVLFQGSSGQAAWKLVGPRGAETVEVRGAISADDHHMVREAAAGQGLALLPIVACAGRDAAAELRRVLPRYAAEGPPLRLVYPSARLVPKRVALLRDQIFQELPPRLKP